MSMDLSAIGQFGPEQVLLSPPTLKNLTEVSLESYVNALKVAGEDLQHSAPVSKEIMAQRLVKFLKDNRDQFNQEQVGLINTVAKKAQLLGNTDPARDFKKLGSLINKISANLLSVEPQISELPISSDPAAKSWGLKSFKLNNLLSAKGIIGTVTAVALAVFIGYTISNYGLHGIQLKDELQSDFKNVLDTFNLGVTFETSPGRGSGTCYGREFSKMNYELSPLLELKGQQLENSIQGYFNDINNVIDNNFAHSLHYKFSAANASSGSKFGLTLEGC